MVQIIVNTETQLVQSTLVAFSTLLVRAVSLLCVWFADSVWGSGI
jgi:hypothetical protein